MTRSLRLAAFCLTLGSAWAQSRIATPGLGAMVDRNGVLRTVSGVAGSFVVGPAQTSGVLALACAGTVCIAKTDAGISTPQEEIATPPGNAVLATDGKRAVAYIAQTGQLLEWRIGGRGPQPVAQPWSANGEVLSILVTPAGVTPAGATPTGPEMAVRRDSGVWIVTSDGTVQDTLPSEATGPVLLLEAGVVYAAGGALDSDGGWDVVLRRADGTSVRLAMPEAPLAIYRMGSDWVEIAANGADYGLDIAGLHVSPGRGGLYVLPQTSVTTALAAAAQ